MGERCLECGVNNPWHHVGCSRFAQQQREVNRRCEARARAAASAAVEKWALLNAAGDVQG